MPKQKAANSKESESPQPAEINAHLVRTLVASQFPQYRNLSVRPVQQSGWDNRTFHLGEAFSVRLPSAKYYAPAVAKEQYWLPRLAPQLTLPIPQPIALGQPSKLFPWPWSIYRWLPGTTAAATDLNSSNRLARELGQFLWQLQRLNTANGPIPGPGNTQRGGPLNVLDTATRRAILDLADQIDSRRATDLWQLALESTWQQAPVWVHGDVAAGNLLVVDQQLAAVIDFGQLVVGDPACDLVIAYTYFDAEAAGHFAAAVALDDATWARARGWALWKALIVAAKHIQTNAVEKAAAPRVLKRLLVDAG